MGQKPIIKILCLDLGGIVIDVRFEHSLRELNIKMELSEIRQFIPKWEAYIAFERGDLGPEQFHREFTAKFKSTLPFENFKKGWNACLHGLLPGVEDLLINRLRPEIPLYALSNTNFLHTSHFKDWPVFKRFHKILTSQDLRARKPEALIYQKTLQVIAEEQKILPQQILFIDDLEENLNGARAFGIHAEHSENDTVKLEKILDQYDLL